MENNENKGFELVRVIGIDLSFMDVFHLTWKWMLAVLVVYVLTLVPLGLLAMFVVFAAENAGNR